MFIDGMEIWYVRLLSEVEVQVKIYQSMWDHSKVEMGNAYHTRDEAELRAEQIRQLLKMGLPSLISESKGASR